jgi:ribosomal protein S18 acetylase RimI-like enzyme
MDISVEYMVKRHLQDVLEVERAAWTYQDKDFGEILHPFHWDEAKFISEVRRKSTVFYVAAEGPVVGGFAVVSRNKDRSSTTVERLAVHPLFRRRSLGSAMLEEILTRSVSNQFTAHVREHDENSIYFFLSKGWRGKLAVNLYGRDQDGIIFSRPD